MKLKLVAATLAALSLTACINQNNLPTPPVKPSVTPAESSTYQKPVIAKSQLYRKTMMKIASGIKDDPYYSKITLDTPEKKAWFKNLTYRLWDRQITSDQFIAEGLLKYPTHRYEFQFIINGFSS